MTKIKHLIIFLQLQLCLTSVGLTQKYSYNNLDSFDDYLGESDSNIQKNNVKEVQCYECYILDGKKDSCILRALTQYDNRGRVTQKVEGADVANGEINFSTRYSYIKNNILRAGKKFFPSALRKEEYRYLFNSDNLGIITGLKFEKSKDGSVELNMEYLFLGNGSILKKKYDNKMNLIDSVLLETPQFGNPKRPDDSIVNIFSRTYVYKYNDSINGKMQIRQTFNTKGKMVDNTMFEEDEKLKTLLFSKKVVYLYDERDNLIRELILSIENTFGSEKKYTYDEKGHLVNYFDDSPSLKTEIGYDAKGRTAEIASSDPYSKRTRSAKYLYDRTTGLLGMEKIFVNSKLFSYKKYIYKNFSK